MTIRFNPRWLFVSILLLSLQFCRAQIVLPPTLGVALGTTNATESQLWDFNGSYVVEMLVERKGQAVPVEVAFSLIHSPNGKLTTTTNDLVNCSVTFNNDNDSSFACLAKISGKVTGVGGVARVHFTVQFVGNGSLAQQSTTIKGSLTVDAFADATTGGQLAGTKQSSFKASFPGLVTIQGKGDFGVGLPPGVDGAWNLTLHLVGLGRITGSGIIATPSELLGLDLSGKFQKGLFTIKATGANDVPNTVTGAGSSGTILVPGTIDTVQFKGKILGQKMAFNVNIPPPADN